MKTIYVKKGDHTISVNFNKNERFAWIEHEQNRLETIRIRRFQNAEELISELTYELYEEQIYLCNLTLIDRRGNHYRYVAPTLKNGD